MCQINLPVKSLITYELYSCKTLFSYSENQQKQITVSSAVTQLRQSSPSPLGFFCSAVKTKRTKLRAYLKRGLHRETEYYSEAVNCTLPDLKSDTCADICYASLFSTTGHFFNLITLKKKNKTNNNLGD